MTLTSYSESQLYLKHKDSFCRLFLLSYLGHISDEEWGEETQITGVCDYSITLEEARFAFIRRVNHGPNMQRCFDASRLVLCFNGIIRN